MRPALLVAVCAFTASLALPAFADDAAKPVSISVTGTGEATAEPDMSLIDARLTVVGKTAQEALDADHRATVQLNLELVDLDVAAKDLKTSSFSLTPQYTSPAKGPDGATLPPSIVGYGVSHGFTITVRNSFTKILDGVVGVGGITAGGITAAIDDPSKAIEEARRAAFADAEVKAKTYAAAAGLGLGHILSIRDTSSNAPRPLPLKAATPVSVENGPLTYAANVEVQWELGAAAN